MYRSLSIRKARFLLSAMALALAVAVFTAFLGISAGIKHNLGHELGSYGANIIVSPPADGSAERLLPTLSQWRHISVEKHLYGLAVMNGTAAAIEIIGLDIPVLERKPWKFFDDFPRRKNQVMAGAFLRDTYMLKTGDHIRLGFDTGEHVFQISGFFEKGGDDDRSIIMSFTDAAEVLNAGQVPSAILISANPASITETVNAIRAEFPSAGVKTDRQIAQAGINLLAQIRLLLILVSAVVIMLTGASVYASMATSILERYQEIGLMKALGARRRSIYAFFGLEAAVMGLCGGLLGFFPGLIMTKIVFRMVFASEARMAVYLLPAVLFGLLLSVVSCHYPASRALKHNAAAILRGEL